MNRSLKIALIQADLVWQNAKQNRINFSEKINNITEKVDVIVLPEMFTTGFSMQPQKIAEYMVGDTVKWMQQIASEKNTAICGSIIISENKNFYNRFIFMHPEGKIVYYNKRHLFTLAGEHNVYTSGEEKLIIEYKVWKICPLVCYDLRFPVWARNVEEYDVLLYVANWPKPRISAWDTLLKGRSIENNLEYSGHSGVYNCLGEEVVKAKPNKEETIIAVLEKNHITETRNTLNFLSDKDVFEIKG